MSLIAEDTKTVEKTYPIAEIFTAPHGEAFWQGQVMMFIRLAGCNVGKPISSFLAPPVDVEQFPVIHEICTAWDGTTFECDTNYKMSEKLTVSEIVSRITNEDHICITGGEPFMHDLYPLMQELKDKYVHFETSGTKFEAIEKLFKQLGPTNNCWVAVAPKMDCPDESLMLADEIKILVDAKTFNEEIFLAKFEKFFNEEKIYICPVNYNETLDKANKDCALNLVYKYPRCKLGMQAHKVWGVR